MSGISGITQASSAIQQAQVQNQVDVAVAKKTLDAQKQQGEAAVQLIESAALISKAPGSGNLINTTA